MGFRLAPKTDAARVVSARVRGRLEIGEELVRVDRRACALPGVQDAKAIIEGAVEDEVHPVHQAPDAARRDLAPDEGVRRQDVERLEEAARYSSAWRRPNCSTP